LPLSIDFHVVFETRVISGSVDFMQVYRTDGLWYSAEYSTFSISDEASKYQLTVNGYSGDAGDALAVSHLLIYISNGMKFSTPDSDNDEWAGGSCASDQAGGWWFKHCSVSAINVQGRARWTTVGAARNVKASRMMVKLV